MIFKFKKKAVDFPPTAGDWAAKEMLIKNIQRKRM
jgi:phosphopantetheinyl transferase (holo-ACP synthase)